MADRPNKISAKVQRVSATSLDDFDKFVEGAGGVAPAPPEPLLEEAEEAPQKPPLPASQLKSLSGGRGRPKKNVKRPWEGLPTSPGARMTLILDPRDKARLDFLQATFDRPAQRFLRAYIEKALRNDAEEAFRQMYPDAAPPEEDD